MITSAIRTSLCILSLVSFTGCYYKRTQLEPNIRHVVKKEEIASLPGPFPPLLPYEKKQAWAYEYAIGVQFGKQLDLYRAITSFKRALILLPDDAAERRMQIEYDIALCFYLGDRYCDVIKAVEESSLHNVSATFCAYREVMLMLYESYMETRQPQRAAQVLQQLHFESPEVAKSSALRRADIACLSKLNDPDINTLLSEYCRCRKSISKAQVLNAALPGSGYLYVGQVQSAITALLLNGLFIYGAYQFYRAGYWAAGAFTTSLEMGWYLGGIYGGGEAAHLYNELLWERVAGPYVCEQKLFPSLMLRWSF